MHPTIKVHDNLFLPLYWAYLLLFTFYLYTRFMVIFTYSFLHLFFLASTLCCWKFQILGEALYIYGESERPIQHNTKSPENLRRIILEYIKKYWAKKIPEGTHQEATSLGASPTPLGTPLGLVGPLASLRCPSSAICRVLT